MTWDGYNFEDAILISEQLVQGRRLHLDPHRGVRDRDPRDQAGPRGVHPRHPQRLARRRCATSTRTASSAIGTRVGPGDILVGKVAPKSKSELTPEEKLLHAIFGRAGEDVKNDSLEVPAGVEGIVIDTQRFSRRMHLTEDEKQGLREGAQGHRERRERADRRRVQADDQGPRGGGRRTRDRPARPASRWAGDKDAKVLVEQIERFKLESLDLRSPEVTTQGREGRHASTAPRIEALKDEKERRLNSLKRGDELPTGVLEMVKVYVATKRVISVGDKMAGRHGNKGVIAKILPEEDMPFLEDGTAVEILLNPLGVPSRMNVGQILETHLGWAAAMLGFQAISPVFDGATEDDHPPVPRRTPACPRTARPCSTTAAPASRSSRRSRSATSTC